MIPFIGLFILALLFAGAADPKPVTVTNGCTQYATTQLPTSVVQQVNQQRTEYGMPEGMTTQTLKAQHINKDWQAVAFTTFLPKYCGFVSNINEYSTTDAGRRGEDLNYDVQNYSVQLIGASVTSAICVSNTVPTVLQDQGKLMMVVHCDRNYSFDTWTETDPVLSLLFTA